MFGRSLSILFYFFSSFLNFYFIFALILTIAFLLFTWGFISLVPLCRIRLWFFLFLEVGLYNWNALLELLLLQPIHVKSYVFIFISFKIVLDFLLILTGSLGSCCLISTYLFVSSFLPVVDCWCHATVVGKDAWCGLSCWIRWNLFCGLVCVFWRMFHVQVKKSGWTVLTRDWQVVLGTRANPQGAAAVMETSQTTPACPRAQHVCYLSIQDCT